MKLIRLKINDPKGFRSLQEGFEIDFIRDENKDLSKFNPYVLAGPNGSGKSNVLEALAAIFYHIDCMYLNYWPSNDTVLTSYENFKAFDSSKCFPDAFELEYFIPVKSEYIERSERIEEKYARIKIEKNLGESPKIRWLNRDVFNSEGNEILISTEVKDFLPSLVVGYSSGENETLSIPFLKMRLLHRLEYKYFLSQDIKYEESEGRLNYIDNEYSQAIFLCVLLLMEPDEIKEIQKMIGVKNIKSFRIRINDPYFYPEDKEYEESSIVKIIKDKILMLKKISTCCNIGHKGDKTYDFWINEETRKAVKLYFGSPRDLFQLFHTLLTLNYEGTPEKPYSRNLYSNSPFIKDEIRKPTQFGEVFTFKDFLIEKENAKEPIFSKSLSDGEHQLLHTLGISLLLKNEDKVLYLFDEPETHFNPSWRAKFISILRDCFSLNGDETGQSKNNEMLITTHTPFLISDSEPENVLVFSKENSIVKVERPEYNTLGASINKITMKTFGKSQTIGGYAERKLEEFRKEFFKGGDKEKIKRELNESLGDSIEKTLLIKMILDSMEND